MKCSIITIGTEILFGDILNTNVKYLSRELIDMGINVYYHYTVGDNESRLKELLEEALSHSDIVVTTGGLGPTEDDLTKETICQVVGDELAVDEKAYDKMMHRAQKRGKMPTPNNLKMVEVPSRSKVLENKVGAAPGFIAQSEDGRLIMALPGPPREMVSTFDSAREYLSKFGSKKVYSRMVRTFGIGESALETLLIDYVHGQTNPTLATYANAGECSLRIASSGKDGKSGEEVVAEEIKAIWPLIGNYVFSLDDEDFNKVVVGALRKEGLTVASAESMTGGGFASAITDIEGSSRVIGSSFVNYSNESKLALGVREETIEKHTVYSEEVAMEMAKCTRERAGVDIGVSISGVAGPRDEGDVAAGTMYIGISTPDGTKAEKHITGSSDRFANRRYAVLAMLNAVYNAIYVKIFPHRENLLTDID